MFCVHAAVFRAAAAATGRIGRRCRRRRDADMQFRSCVYMLIYDVVASIVFGGCFVCLCRERAFVFGNPTHTGTGTSSDRFVTSFIKLHQQRARRGVYYMGFSILFGVADINDYLTTIRKKKSVDARASARVRMNRSIKFPTTSVSWMDEMDEWGCVDGRPGQLTRHRVSFADVKKRLSCII